MSDEDIKPAEELAEAAGPDNPERRELAQMAGAMLLAGAVLSSGKAEAGGHNMGELPDFPPSDPVLYKEIDAVLKKTEELYNKQEWWRLGQEVWDREDPLPVFAAEELYKVMVGWETLDRYLFPKTKGLDAFRWGYSNLFVKELAPGVALAIHDHWFEIKLKAPPPIGNPRHYFDRILAIYNNRDGEWKQSLYANCPHGIETQSRRIAEALVGDDWDEFYADIQSRELNDPRLKKK